jgi:hypothetical protein
VNRLRYREPVAPTLAHDNGSGPVFESALNFKIQAPIRERPLPGGRRQRQHPEYESFVIFHPISHSEGAKCQMKKADAEYQ